jgi:hypothetical protein
MGANNSRSYILLPWLAGIPSLPWASVLVDQNLNCLWWLDLLRAPSTASFPYAFQPFDAFRPDNTISFMRRRCFAVLGRGNHRARVPEEPGELGLHATRARQRPATLQQAHEATIVGACQYGRAASHDEAAFGMLWQGLWHVSARARLAGRVWEGQFGRRQAVGDDATLPDVQSMGKGRSEIA